MSEILEKIDHDGERKISDKEWSAIESLLNKLEADGEIGTDTCHGRRCFIDKEEDRPLSQEETLELIAKKYIKKPIGDYGLSPDICRLLEDIFKDYGYPAF